MDNINRRDFIKISSVATAGMALTWSGSSFVGDLFGKEEMPLSESVAKKIPTVCEVCFWNCAGWAYMDRKGEIQKIKGNKNDPHSNGRFCPRGTGGVGMYTDNDRLKKPMIREGKPGEQKFREASWEEAIDHIVKKMKEIESKYGREAMALLHHGKTGPHFEYLFEAYGSGNIAEPAGAQCLITREAGFIATYGAGLASPEPTDVRNAKCLVLIGNHIGENMHNGHVQDMSHLIDNGGTVITVDPRFSTAAGHSKYWLPIKPGTDMALLLAWMNVIINEGIYDKEYVERYTYGFDMLKDHVQKYTPEWASAITTLSAADIRKTAREMAAASPKVIVHPGRHTAWYGDDTQRTRAIAILNAILGSYGRVGGFYFPERVKPPHYPHPPLPKPKWSWKDYTKEKHKMAIMGITNIVIDHALPEYKGKHAIKGMFITATNIIQSVPDVEKTKRALQNLDLVVVVDTMPSEITGYADVILPEATYLERYDHLRTSHHKVPNIALRAPVAKPRWETKPGWWIAREIGIKLGLQKYYQWENFEEVLDWQLRQVGTSLAEMKEIGVKKYKKKEKLYLDESEQYWFNTNTGKIELYSTDFAEWGYDALPVYKAKDEAPAGYMNMIYGRIPMHTFGRTTNSPNLFDLREEGHLWIHPKVAKIFDIESGQEVWLKNQDGKISTFPSKVRVTQRISPSCVYLPHGYGSTSKKLSRVYGKGSADYEMITNIKIDPETGGTGMRNNFVTLLTENPHKNIES